MKQLLIPIASLAAVLTLLIAGCDSETIVQQDNPPPLISQVPGSTPGTFAIDSTSIPGQYIVVYKSPWQGLVRSEVAPEALEFVNTRISELGIADSAVKHRYEYALRGFAAKLTDTQLRALQDDPRVKYIEQDRKFKAFASTVPSVATSNYSSHQTTPWGVQRVRGPFNGTGTRAWILDTGIDLDHPDLNVDTDNSASFVASESADDQHGHGTHVAGILAARDNTRDVVGVAAGASVVAVKVCDQDGICVNSDIVAGVNYVSNWASTGDIINMSLGGPISQTLDDEVTNAANAGLRFTIAAGNEKQDANNVSPARVEHPNVWTVSAFKKGDDFAVSFDCNTNQGSNFSGPTNPPIEYSAPGNNIPSLDIGSSGTIRCGTSMAAPHVAGLLLTSPNGLTDDGFVSSDPDNDPDPIAFPDIYLSVTISGPTSLYIGEEGTWTADVSRGDGNYAYEWYYKSADTNDQWTGPVSTTDSYTTQMYDFDQYLDLRCDVSDGDGRTGSDIHHVDCTDCSDGGGMLSTDN